MKMMKSFNENLVIPVLIIIGSILLVSLSLNAGFAADVVTVDNSTSGGGIFSLYKTEIIGCYTNNTTHLDGGVICFGGVFGCYTNNTTRPTFAENNDLGQNV